jgi:hypothetical protein
VGSAIAIGYQAGLLSQSNYSIVIGDTAASVVANAPGADSIAIGKNASANAAFDDTITLSAAPPPFSLEPSGINRTHIYPIREDYRDSILVYDDPTYNPDTSSAPVLPPQSNRYEINTACYAMPLYTYFPPEHIDNSGAEWISYSFTGITEIFPFGGIRIPGCQTNSYNYYLIDCNALVVIGPGPILKAGQQCIPDTANFPVRPCRPYFVIAVDPNGRYDQCCMVTGYWWYGITNPEETVQITWTGSVGWLRDKRSNIPANTIPGIDVDSKILLLGANHTV